MKHIYSLKKATVRQSVVQYKGFTQKKDNIQSDFNVFDCNSIAIT